MAQIQTGAIPQGLVLEGAAVSPDGEQVAAAYSDSPSLLRGRTAFTVFVRIWNIGTQEAITSNQLSAVYENNAVAQWHGPPDGFVQYCDNGLGIMVADSRGTLYYLNSQTLEVVHATATNLSSDVILQRVFCAANSPRAVFAADSGALGDEYGNGLVRVYDLTSGKLLQEWDMRKNHHYFGDVAISPSGNKIAVSRVPGIFGEFPIFVQNLELFDVDTGKVTLRVKTRHSPGRISFVGETQIATAGGLTLQWFFPRPKIKLWDSSNGKLIREFAAPKVGARRFVGASSDGKVILGYIPKENLLDGRFETGPSIKTLEQRFRLWDARTGQTIATSPPILPIKSYLPAGFDPSLEISANGRAVIVFWKSHSEILPIYVFSLAPAPALQPQ